MIDIGDKVVCVDDTPGFGTVEGDYSFPNGYLVKNKIYNIEKIVEFFFVFKDGEDARQVVAYHLTGIKSIDIKDGEEILFEARRFRKIEELREEIRLNKKTKIPVKDKVLV